VRRSAAGRTSATYTYTFKGLALLFPAALVLFAGCGNAGSAQTSGHTTRHTTRPTLNVAPEPSARAGQLPVRPGRQPTKGPIGLDPSESDGVQLNVLSGLLDDTPVFNGDFADPFALRTADDLYVYASNTETTQYAAGAHVPVIELASDSGFEGHYLGDALPVLPAWTVTGFQWAPSVWARPDGTYVMYYSTPATIPLGCRTKTPPLGCVKTTNGESSAMCISHATSADPAGPFVDDSSSAFVCPVAQGGAIDPSVFVAPDGTPWLLWKSDGDCCNLPTEIYSQQLSADGLSTVGPPHRLLGASQAWEGNLVEGPSMVENANTYWLFYSANQWGSQNYGIGVARCATVVGPCTKPLDHAWLSSALSDGQSDPGPGGEEFFQAGGLIWMVHHGLAPGQSGDDAQRRLYADLLVFPAGDRTPRLAPRSPAAALAVAVLYFGDPNLPSQPQKAFLALLRKVPSAFAYDTDRSLVADGQLACAGLAHEQGAAEVIDALTSRGLDQFEADLVSVSATESFCPQDGLQADRDVQQALNTAPSNASPRESKFN
jgi:hypothetical protein